MTYNFYINFFLEAKSQKSVKNVSAKIKKILANEFNVKIISTKNNSFYVEKEFGEWENAIYEIIKLSQNIGRLWLITGDIENEISLWTNDPAIIGVKSIEIQCDKIRQMEN